MTRLGTIPIYFETQDERILAYLQKNIAHHELHTGHTLPKGEYVNPTQPREGLLSALSDLVNERGLLIAVAEFATFSLFILSLWALFVMVAA